MKKNLNRSLEFLIFVIVILFNTNSCDNGGSSPTAQELAFEKLSGSWTFGTTGAIVVDDQDVSLNYNGFGLSFTDGGYTTSNAGDLFGAQGNWSWGGDSAELVLLDDGKSISILQLTESVFEFSFFHNNGSQAYGINGQYTVALVK